MLQMWSMFKYSFEPIMMTLIEKKTAVPLDFMPCRHIYDINGEVLNNLFIVYHLGWLHFISSYAIVQRLNVLFFSKLLLLILTCNWARHNWTWYFRSIKFSTQLKFSSRSCRGILYAINGFIWVANKSCNLVLIFRRAGGWLFTAYGWNNKSIRPSCFLVLLWEVVIINFGVAMD